jgi:hypothetical protein
VFDGGEPVSSAAAEEARPLTGARRLHTAPVAVLALCARGHEQIMRSGAASFESAGAADPPAALRKNGRPVRQTGRMATAPQQQVEKTAVQVLAGLGGVAALILGFLYALGAFLKVSELNGADLSIRDTFVLVPLEQHLARGIGEIFTSTFLLSMLAIFPLSLVLIDVAGRPVLRYVMGSAPQQVDEAETIVKGLAEADVEEHDRRVDALRPQVERARELLDRADREDNEEARREAHRLLEEAERELDEPRMKEVREKVDRARSLVDRAQQQLPEMHARTRRVGLWGLGVVTLVTFALLPVPIAIGNVAFLVVGLLTYKRLANVRQQFMWIMVLYLLTFGAGRVIYSYANPQPLPEARVAVRDGSMIRGDVISVTDTAWYIATRKDAYRSVPVDRIKQAESQSETRREWRSLLEIIVDDRFFN